VIKNIGDIDIDIDILYCSALWPTILITAAWQCRHHVNGDHAFLWEMVKFDPSQNQTPSLVDMKL